MEEYRKREDYRDAVHRLDGLHSSYETEQRYLLLFKRFELEEQEQILIIRVYDGNYVWMQKIDRKTMDDMRTKSDIKGSYYSFCELLKSSVENNKYDLLQLGCELSIIFYFQLTAYVQLRGTLELFQGVPITEDEDTLTICSQFIFDLYESMRSNRITFTSGQGQEEQNSQKQKPDLIDIDIIPDQKPPPPKKNLYLLGQEVLQQEEEVVKQQRPNQNIVMPKQKKRKTNGAKID